MNATLKMRLGFGVSRIRFVQLQFGRISLSDHFFKVRIGNFQKVAQISVSQLIPSMVSSERDHKISFIKNNLLQEEHNYDPSECLQFACVTYCQI